MEDPTVLRKNGYRKTVDHHRKTTSAIAKVVDNNLMNVVGMVTRHFSIVDGVTSFLREVVEYYSTEHSFNAVMGNGLQAYYLTLASHLNAIHLYLRNTDAGAKFQLIYHASALHPRATGLNL
ncbi:hypothetical protein HAX54_019155 [Datura stramonium]|uniref:Uncharacterized protein n=1 Tax=Datura stramonium TaxID=4076 RepID=A0ABS8URE4_DATST|nr:hypothetical protein [Datura stramonium]